MVWAGGMAPETVPPQGEGNRFGIAGIMCPPEA